MPLTIENVNTRVLEAEYAVRGPIVARANEIAEELKASGSSKNKKYTFDKVIFCNIGNPQAVSQPPLSFPREVLSLLTAPSILHSPKVAVTYPPDVIRRAQSMVAQMGNTGGYTESAGYAFVREHIADFISARDNAAHGKPLPKADPRNIFLTNGASQAVMFTLEMLLNKSTDGIMIPIPQYPLYTAALTLLDGTPVPYYLDEAKNWAVTPEQLEEAYDKATQRKINVRALVIINPGNPTGQLLDVELMRGVVEWAHKRKVTILSDEVYQQNIYSATKKFHSMREVVLAMGAPIANEVQLFSFHSASKGIHGECGRRGGYVELLNFPSDVWQAFLKLQSINLCPNITGQLLMDLIVRGPSPQDESYEKHQREYDAVYESLKRRAKALPVRLRQVPGITCNDIEGAMYAFPQLRLPKKFVDEAVKAKRAPDAVWCSGLVEEEGIVTVPGSGFGQAPGTHHFRTTILPPDHEMDEVAKRIDAYQRRLIAKYGPIDNAKL
jgi:aspartate/methionine/tyrosine aminotransferase